jgi:hypothetical protein
VTAFAEWPLGGYTVAVRDGRLRLQPLMGEAGGPRAGFRDHLPRAEEIDASLVFSTDTDGRGLLLGAKLYAEQRARWPIDLARLALALAILVATSPLLAALVWGAGEALGRGRDSEWWAVRGLIIATYSHSRRHGRRSPATRRASPGRGQRRLGRALPAHAAVPGLRVITLGAGLQAGRAGAPRGLVAYGTLTSLAHLGLASYLAWWGVLGIRTWTY